MFCYLFITLDKIVLVSGRITIVSVDLVDTSHSFSESHKASNMHVEPVLFMDKRATNDQEHNELMAVKSNSLAHSAANTTSANTDPNNRYACTLHTQTHYSFLA